MYKGDLVPLGTKTTSVELIEQFTTLDHRTPEVLTNEKIPALASRLQIQVCISHFKHQIVSVCVDTGKHTRLH